MSKPRTLGRIRGLDQSSMGLDWCHEFYRESGLLTEKQSHERNDK